MWSSFGRSDRIFNVFITGFVGFISFLQFYAALDVYKANNLIPITNSAMKTIGKRELRYYLASKEEKREILAREIEEQEMALELKEKSIE